MDEDNHILTLATEKHFFTDQLLPCFLRGENATLIWVPHGGRKKILSFLVHNYERFDFLRLGRCKLAYADFDELTEATSEAYFNLLILALGCNLSKEGGESAFLKLKKCLEERLNQGEHLIIILGRFDELDFPSLFFHNLNRLWELDKTKVHFIFAINKNIYYPELLSKYGNLVELLSQNRIYFPLLSPEDSFFSIERLINKYGYKISQDQRKTAFFLGGGHPALTKICLRIFSEQNVGEMKKEKLVALLGQRWEVKKILSDIWESLHPEEKGVIKLLTSPTPKKVIIPEFLLKLKIVGAKGTLFSPLFSDFVLQQSSGFNALTLDGSFGDILLNGQPLKEKVTLNEYQLLRFFLKNPERIVSRDQLADILWGKEAYDKYSDWAIDKMISQLRKRLSDWGVALRLQTVRSRGYRWLK